MTKSRSFAPVFSAPTVRSPLPLLMALAMMLVLGASPAAAQFPTKAKSTKTEAKFVSYDATKQTITVKVLKPGPKPKSRELAMKPGSKAEFKIKPEGSVLERTSITADGRRASVSDIPDDKTLNIYWIPDQQDPKMRFARKIDMVYTDEELEARDKARLEEARSRGEVADDDASGD